MVHKTQNLIDHEDWKLWYLYTIIGVFITGIFIHRVFCVRTAVDKLLFP